ncbi:T9SS type A sorting domain-containing protein [Panacibacter ginsenosidivorans]|uniref:T9SS type A sorting domain-containing protein n=1 Tax=Panacibacter ginsenosidivorans TaxID=1813871 RepID=A0A5B8V7G5_9BACT|nr:T9SS type A sorting domain-containing protein [Panacibacter ginsenosidivorans]QEC66863.1 T9SS type A sorting domain-containing protein [Panacibacter ginsenosidivorans]
MKTKFYFLLLVTITTIANQTLAQTLVKNMSSTNGDVYAVYKNGSSYYLGGTFNYVGLNTGYGALTKSNNDYPNMDFPQFNGQVYTIIPDGNGGWYAGGYFTVVGGISKSYLVHIKSDNSVDANFNGNCNNVVRAILKVGGRLYIGGSFTTVNGTARLYAAALNSTTGALLNAWNPAPNSTVNTISASFGTDTTIWLGGYFTTINATNLSRPYLAKVNTTNGNFISGSLSADYIVNKITKRGDSVFVAGDFSRLGLKTDYLSTITEGSSSSSQTMPNANGRISCIISDGTGGWYVGGQFTQIGGVSKNYVAHIKSDKTVDASFTASCNSYVFAMVKDGTRLYLGGYFTTVNGTTRNYIAAVSTTTGAVVTGWDGNANSYVYTLAVKGTEAVIAGGYFTVMKGKNAYHVAALSKTDGTPIGGLPGYNNYVNKVAVRGDSILTGGAYTYSGYYSPYSAKMTTTSITQDPNFPATNGLIYSVVPDGAGNYYVGGSFTTIGGVNQAYVAKLNSSFQVLTGWAPAVNNQVRTMVLSGTTLYIGGLFSTTNAVSRPYISALSTANPGSNKTWNSSLNSYTYSLVTDGTSIYAGGIFTLVNGSTTRNLLAKFDLSGNLNATWNPNATGGGGSVEKLAISGTNILAGGSFTTIGGVARNYLAKLNNTNGAASNWATANSYVLALYAEGTTCYVGGYFTQLTSQSGSITSRNYLGGITISNGAINAFNPNPNSYVYTIGKSGTNLYYGGTFTTVNGTDRKYIAASNTSTSALQTWNPSANYVVNAINIDTANKNVFIGGSFSGFQETSHTYASVIKYATKALLGWNPVLDNAVYDITYNKNKIIIGGAFHTVNGSARNGFAAFGLTGALLGTNLNLTKGGSSNVSVWSLFANDTTVYVGGDFDKAGSVLRNDFAEAKIITGAGTILPTNPFADNIVYAINVQGTTIVYGGDFRFSNFTGRNYVGIIRNSTGVILPWNPSPDSYVFDVAVNYNRIFLVGQFDNVAGTPHPGAAAFGLTGSLLAWDPQLTRAGYGVYADLNSVTADSNNVYLGGYFDHARGQVRNNAAAVSASTAALQTWDPGPDYIVRAIGLNGTNLLVGGDFSFCKGASRQYLAKIDSATGLVNTTWNPGANGYVYALNGNGSNIYVGGNFSQLATVTRTSLGSVSASTGAATSFDPVIQSNGGQGTVSAIAFDSSNFLYVGGTFNTAKGTTRNNLASYTTAGAGTLRTWNPDANNTVNSIAINSATIYVGGNFTTLNGGTIRNHLASVNTTTGTLLTFNPDINSNVNALSISNNNLYVGGQFTSVKGGTTTRSYLAAYTLSAGNLTGWNPVANSYIYGLASATDTVYPGGYLYTLNGVTRNHLGAVRGAAGTATLAFDPNLNYYVWDNFIARHELLTGGNFTTVGGNFRRGFAVFKLPGSGPSSSLFATDNSQLNSTPLQKQFALYPNPVSSGTVTLQLGNAIAGKFSVIISGMDGKKVYQKSFETFTKNEVITISTLNLKNGTYIVNVIGAQTNWSNMLIISK